MFFGLFGSTKKASKKSKKVVKKSLNNKVVTNSLNNKVVKKVVSKRKLTGRRKNCTKKGGAIRSGSLVQGMNA